MIDRKDDDPRDDADLEEALRALPPVEADGEFRRRLREAFVSGELGSPAVPGDAEATARGARLWFLLPLGAAAAVLVVAVGMLLLGDREPVVRVFDVSGTGSVTVNGRAIPVADRERLEASLRPGADVTVPPSATLDLVVPGTALFELTGGTRLVLPWAAGDAPGRLTTGEVRFASGPDFAGREMTLLTPDGLVVVTGTLLSVQCDDSGSCVCVLEGTVRVGVNEADLEPVPPGRRKVMMRDGRTEVSPVAPPHREGVLRFVERAAGRFPRK